MKPELFSTLSILFISLTCYSAEEIIKKKHYTISYNEDHEVANWVSYDLDHSKLKNCVKRSNNFKADPAVSTGTAVAADYKHSGFDRGHLVPAGDMKFSKEAMDDTFYFSNMTPQPGKFNQGRWSVLENLIRSWGARYNRIWIVTGPILKDNLPVMGKQNQISIPEQYFKVIIKKTRNVYEGIGFLMDTSVPYQDLTAYVKSIDEIELLSGNDFFQNLEDSAEKFAERSYELKNWDFTGKFEYFPCQP